MQEFGYQEPVALELGGALLEPHGVDASSQPVELTGLVYLGNSSLDSDEIDRLRRVQWSPSGEVERLWELELPRAGNWGGGFFGSCLIVCGPELVCGVDPETGVLLWSHGVASALVLPLEGQTLRLMSHHKTFHVDARTGTSAPLQQPLPFRWFHKERRFIGWSEVPYLYAGLDGLSVCCEEGTFSVRKADHHRQGVVAITPPRIGEHRPVIDAGWEAHGHVLATPRGWLSPLRRTSGEDRQDVGFGLFEGDAFEACKIMFAGVTASSGHEYLDLWLGSTPEVVALCCELFISSAEEAFPQVVTCILDLAAGRTLGVLSSRGLERFAGNEE